jgi:hypothetical protein
MKPDRLRNIFLYILLFVGVLVLLTTVEMPLTGQRGPTLVSLLANLNLIPLATMLSLLVGPVVIIVASAVVVEIQWENLIERRFQPLPDSPDELSEATQPLMRLLTEHQFIRLGTSAYATSLFVLPSASPTYVSRDRQVVALVTASGFPPRAGLLLQTLYANGALLATYYPSGPLVNQRDFETLAEKDTPAQALERHQRHMQDFGARHGAVQPVMGLKDHSAWWSTNGARHWPATKTGFQLALWLLIPLIPMALIAFAVNSRWFDTTIISGLITVGNPVVITWLLYSIVTGRIRFASRH